MSQTEPREWVYDCLDCKDSGFRPTRKEGETGVVECECRQQRIAESRLSQIYDQFGAYSEAKLEKFDPMNSGQRDAHAIITANPLGNYHLHGSHNGRGKTWLLVAQYRYVRKKGIPAQIRTSRQLVEELRQAEVGDEDKRKPSVVMELATTAPKFHLFWDDCEKAAARTDFRQEALFELIDTIRRRGLGISLTSNCPIVDSSANYQNPTDLRFKLSSPIAARLHGMCRSIML